MEAFLQKIINHLTWKKILTYIFVGGLITFYIILSINDPFGILVMIGIVGGAYFSEFIHIKLLDLNKIEWDAHRDIKKLSGWLCFGYCLFIFLIACLIINLGFDNLTLGYGLYLIFSLWTYREVMLAKDNALLLLRSFLLFSLFVMGYLITEEFLSLDSIEEYCENWHQGKYLDILIVVFQCFILPSLIIKGISIAFSKKCSEVYANQKYRFKDIAAITLIMIGIVFCYKNYFSFSKTLEVNNSIENKIATE